MSPAWMAPILEWYHVTMALCEIGTPAFEGEAWKGIRLRARRRRTPYVTIHAVERFRHRYATHLSLKQARLAMSELASRAYPTGETTRRGTAIWMGGGVRMVVCNGAVVTVYSPEEEAAA